MKNIAIIILSAFLASTAFAQAVVTIDSNTKYQTIEGWGHGGGIFSSLNYEVDSAIRDTLNLQYLNFITDDLGLTGSRMWEVGPRIDGTGMDNGDCDSIDWSKFQSRQIDTMIAKYAVYFKNRVEAEGFKTSFYSSTSYPTGATASRPWVLNHPGERAQQIWANALWWKNNFGIDINYDVIYNEPNGAITGQILVDDIKALGPRLLDRGLATKTQFAEAVAPQTDWNFITPFQTDADLWKYVGRLSYHNYGTADPYRADIRDFAKSLGIPTAQTEMGNPTIDDLFNDLIFGGVTYWEIAFSGSSTLVPTAGNTGWTPSSTYFRMRQLLHYVRPGAIRIGTTSSDSLLRVLSFNQNGKVTTVLLNTGQAKSVDVSGLPSGKYGLSQSSPGTGTFQELGIQTVGNDGKLNIALSNSGLAVTLYPYSGVNHPPTIMSAVISPGYVVLPTSTASLTAKANDAELDFLVYHWSIASQPVGANAVIANPMNSNTNVSGLTVAGNYVFTITVNDGIYTSSSKVYLIVYPTNPPAMLGQAGFRFAAPYGLVFTATGDTTHAIIELPVSSATLQVQVGDLANSNFTGRGKWTMISQPSGANAKLDTTIYIYISIRAQVSNMLIPGDYVFQCNVTNPGHADLTTRVICTVHPQSSGPVINSISATPQTLILPQSSSQLTGNTSDSQGQLLRHWWYAKSVPNGAKPIFDHQGLANSKVSGLTIPGSYVFTLRSFDDIHMTTKDVTIVVQKASGVNNMSTFDAKMMIFPNPVSNYLNLKYSIKENAEVSVTIINSIGIEVMRILDKQFEVQGNHELKVDASTVPSGVYYCSLTLGNQRITKKFVIAK